LCIESEDTSQEEQASSDAKTSGINDTRFSCLKSIPCGALLGKTPFFRTLFPNRAIDQSFEDVFNNRMRLIRSHLCGLGENLAFRQGL